MCWDFYNHCFKITDTVIKYRFENRIIFLEALQDDSRVQSIKKMLRQSIEKRFMSNIPLKDHFNVLMSIVHFLCPQLLTQGINCHFSLMSKNI